MKQPRASRNRTLTLNDPERQHYAPHLLCVDAPVTPEMILNRTLHGDLFAIVPYLPTEFVDLLILDPPYNLTKDFGTAQFQQTSTAAYQEWVETWLLPLLRTLKPTASVYCCGDWRSAAALQLALEKPLILRNRITWERDKGRGAKANWKNNAEDIWFATVSDTYTFNIEAIKVRRRVIAPYRDSNGTPKDWTEDGDGQKIRLTHPSNLWTDITIPFWSMPENTDHPTQKPEKLIAKLILASSNPGDVVLDPFLGSGTTSVVAKKLDRHYVGIEVDETYACLAEKRLALAEQDRTIQGYAEGVFWERNSR